MMDWGLISVGLAVVLLLGHLFFDFRSLALKLRGPHSSGSYDTGYIANGATPAGAGRRSYVTRSTGRSRRSSSWLAI